MAKRHLFLAALLLNLSLVCAARGAPVTWTFYETSCTPPSVSRPGNATAVPVIGWILERVRAARFSTLTYATRNPLNALAPRKRSKVLMGWTAPAPRHRCATTWSS